MTGYGVLVYAGRLPRFEALFANPGPATRHAAALANHRRVRRVEVDRWERGRIVEPERVVIGGPRTSGVGVGRQ